MCFLESFAVQRWLFMNDLSYASLAKANFASIVPVMEKAQGKVRWGFIGAGYIAKLALYPALLNSKDGEIYAVGAKDRERGLALSPSGLVYTDYDELLADPKVEAIYISLPNSLHIEWSIKAMRAGKHVLCEKPAAMNVAELKEAIAVANETGLIFMEASWNRWHPRTLRLKEIVDSGLIGEVKTIRSAFTYDGLDPCKYSREFTNSVAADFTTLDHIQSLLQFG
jgi:D-xylose 1-dehydrogenase (NADP+, D-xylono-1,5-lactone-forming)